MMSTTVHQKQNKVSTRQNFDTSKGYTKQKLLSRQYAYDDSNTCSSMVYGYECFLAGQKYNRGAVYAGSSESAKLIAEARHPEACEVRVGVGCKFIVNT